MSSSLIPSVCISVEASGTIAGGHGGPHILPHALALSPPSQLVDPQNKRPLSTQKQGRSMQM